MRFGLYLYTSSDAARAAQERFRDELDEQVQAARESGFASIWMPEHHAASRFFPPPFQLLTWLSARNPGMTVGTHIALAPLYHPLALAESIATLDWLSGGNLVVGFGSGFREAEFAAVGSDVDARFRDSREVMRVVDLILRGERVSFEIGPWRGKDASVTVKPFSHPRAPFLWAATRETALPTALKCADGLMPNLMAGIDEQLRLLDLFDQQRGSVAEVRPLTVDVVLAGSRGEAEERAVRSLGAEYGSFKHWRALVPQVGEFASGSGNVALIAGQAVVGTVEDLLPLVERCRERGVTDIILRLQHAQTPQREVLDAIDAIGTGLIQQFASARRS